MASIWQNKRLSLILRVTLQLIIGASLLWWIVVTAQLDSRPVIETFRRPSLLPMLLSVMFFGLSMILKICQLRLFLPSRIPSVYLAGLTLSQNALLTFLPWRVGEASVPLSLRQNFDIPLQQSVPTLVVVRVSDFVIVMSVALCGGLQFDSPIFWGTAISVALATAVIWWLVRSGHADFLRTMSELQTWRDAVAVVRNPRRVAACVVFAALIFVATTLQSMFAIQAMGLPIAFFDIALLNAASLLAALVPIHPPGGWGTIDSIQVAILSWLGYDAQITLPAILATHGLYTVIILLGGLLGWWLSRGSRKP